MGFVKRGNKSARRFGPPETVRQKTLKTSINCAGVGLHSGDKIIMTLNPAGENTGIRFKRVDIAAAGALIQATWDNVVDTRMNTTIGNADGVTIGTVEHLMAALAGCGVDNALIEINGQEVPIMDGSAAPFVFLIECAGVVEQSAPRRFIKLHKSVLVSDGDCVASLVPDNGFSFDFEIDFESPAVSRQTFSLGLVNGSFKKELARARTFGFLHDVEPLRAAGLAKGGSLDNVVVISGDKILNEGGLRFDDEFVRHKVLDAVGDLYLAGAPVIGCFSGVCSGHAATNRLLRALFADKEAWSFVTMSAVEAESLTGGDGWFESEPSAIAATA